MAGNISSSSSATVVVDSDTATQTSYPPVTIDIDEVSDTGVSTTDRITNDNTPTFIGTGMPNMPIKLAITNDGSPTCETTTDQTGTWTCTLMISEGTHTAVATQGQKSTELSFVIDTRNVQPTTRPDLATISDDGTSNTDDITSTEVLSIWGYAESNSFVQVIANGELRCDATASVDGYWSCEFTVPGPEVYAISTIEVDVAGNDSPMSEVLTVTVLAPETPTEDEGPVAETVMG